MHKFEQSTSNRRPEAVAQHVADEQAIFTLPACPHYQGSAQQFPIARAAIPLSTNGVLARPWLHVVTWEARSGQEPTGLDT